MASHIPGYTTVSKPGTPCPGVALSFGHLVVFDSDLHPTPIPTGSESSKGAHDLGGLMGAHSLKVPCGYGFWPGPAASVAL